MRKIIKYFITFEVISLIVGFIVSFAEKKRERVNWKGQIEHQVYGTYEKYFKRPFDFTLSLSLFIVLFPVFLVIAVMVRVKLGIPVIFSQDRPGKNGKIFRLYKFRSMSDATDENGNLLPDKDRLTNFGNKLRSSSLDELPELLNILKGDMSFVGPRPLAVQYLPYYNEQERHRHDVSPGLTGLAQVHGRNATTWEERFFYDLQYVKKITFIGDIKIFLMTIKTVICHFGIGVRGVDSPQDFDKYRNEKKEEDI